MRFKGRKWASPFFIISLAVAGLFGASAAVINKQVADTPIVEKAEAAEAQKDFTLLIATSNDLTTWFDGCQPCIYYWGNDIEAKTLLIHKSTNKLGYVTLPKGVTNFEVLRAHDLTLPLSGFPDSSKIYKTNDGNNNWDSVTYVATQNVFQVWGWNHGNVYYETSVKKVILPQDAPVFIGINDDATWWYGDNAVLKLYYILENDFYLYGKTSGHLELSRIGTTNIFYCRPTFTIVADRLQGQRYVGGSTVNTTTNITVGDGFYNTCITYFEGGGGTWTKNWGPKDNPTTVTAYGQLFLNSITCSGSGSVTSDLSAWTQMATDYNLLGLGIQGSIWSSSASQSGDIIQQAMARYDYIVFYKEYAGYNDFIGRSLSSGKSSFGIRNFTPLELLIDGENDLSTVIIIIASSVSLLSITALSVLLVKKKKRKEY